MAPNPQCSALANAQASKGLSYAAIASQIGSTEQHVTNICTGAVSPTQDEFNAIASVLGITSSAPHIAAHSTK